MSISAPASSTSGKCETIAVSVASSGSSRRPAARKKKVASSACRSDQHVHGDGSRRGEAPERPAGCPDRASGAHRRGCPGTRGRRGAPRAARRCRRPQAGVGRPRRTSPTRPGGAAERLGPAAREGGVAGDVPERRRLQDRALEEPVRTRHDEQVERAQRAGGLARDGDARRVAAERLDRVAHPLERRDLVEQAPVARRSAGRISEIGVVEPAEAAEPVVEGDHHDPGRCREPGAVVDARTPRAEHESAAVDPHEHRTQAGGSRRRHPHVEVETALGPGRQRAVAELAERSPGLRRDRAGDGCLAHLAPRGHGLGGREAPRLRVRDAREAVAGRGRPSAQCAGRRLDDGRRAPFRRWRARSRPGTRRGVPRPTRSRGSAALRCHRSRPRPRLPAAGRAMRHPR